MERINVNLPRPILEDLRRLVPPKRRSEVIARATARELRRLKIAALFEELARAPIWRTEDYPQLPNGEAIDQFILQLRMAGTRDMAARAALARRKARRE